MSKLSTALDYLRYRTSSQTKYDIHSPFVFDLVTHVLNDKKNRIDYTAIESLRNELLKNETVVNVHDLGAGSAKNNSGQRKVKDICRNASLDKKYAQLLYRLAAHFKPGFILELGTSLGLTTLYLSRAAPSAQILTLEGCPETAAIAGENFRKLNAANISQVTGNFDQTLIPSLANCKPETVNCKLFFFDGNHRKEPTLRYFSACLPYVTNDSIMIFDDIHWSEEMEEAWEAIKEHPSITVSIDLFRMGLVFFRKEQTKEHFVIRF